MTNNPSPIVDDELVTQDKRWLLELAVLMRQGHQFTEGRAHAPRAEAIADRITDLQARLAKHGELLLFWADNGERWLDIPEEYVKPSWLHETIRETRKALSDSTEGDG